MKLIFIDDWASDVIDADSLVWFYRRHTTGFDCTVEFSIRMVNGKIKNYTVCMDRAFTVTIGRGR